MTELQHNPMIEHTILAPEMAPKLAGPSLAGTDLVLRAQPSGLLEPDAENVPAVRQVPHQAPRLDGHRLRKLLLIGASLFALAGSGYFGWEYWTVGRFQVSTDDAHVKADSISRAHLSDEVLS
jgi:hypothetical protein